MIRAGILSFSDGRPRVHDTLKDYIKKCESDIIKVVSSAGITQIMTGEIICSGKMAKNEAKKISAFDPHVLILNIPVFAFPNFSVIARNEFTVPAIAVSPKNPGLPGLGGLLAAVDMIRQTGGQCEKIWGDLNDARMASKFIAFLKAAYAKTALKGQIYGLIGGRSIGMGSGSADPDRYMRIFGVDTEHIDQLELVRLASMIKKEETEKAFTWLTENISQIYYDDNKLTPDSLKEQIKYYIAVKQLIAQYGLSFVGIKCHYELSENYVTQCISAALSNDPYDWDGAKDTVVCSCEADSDGALTMQILKHLSGLPVMFFDFRHFYDKNNVFAFCNCGSMATWYSQRSGSAEDNLKKVTLCPVIQKYGGKGCHLRYNAAPGEITCARLSRRPDKYIMSVFKGRIIDFPDEAMKDTCDAWPHAFTKIEFDPYMLIENYHSNHVHAVYGDHINELVMFCDIMGIEINIIE